MDTPRVGIFLSDYQGALSKALPLDKLAERLAKDESLVVRVLDKSLDNGARQDIAQACSDLELTGVVACGLNDQELGEHPLQTDDATSIATPMIHINLLERSAWTSDGEEEALERAERQVRMAAAKAGLARPIALADRAVNRDVVVVGGGHGALQAALATTKAGLKTTVLRTDAPSGCFYPIPESLLATVKDNNDITVVEGTELRRLDGQLGAFQLDYQTDAGRQTLECGAVVVAVDAELVPPDEEGAHRMALRQWMEEEADKKTVAIWLDRNGPERRCSAQASLTRAINQVKAGGRAAILFRNMPVYGRQGQKRYDDARALGVAFYRYDTSLPTVTEEGEGLKVSVVDAVVPTRTIDVTVDKLVLPGTVKPRLDNPVLADLLRQPLDAEGFLQPGNVRVMPVDSPRRGIHFAGGCHADCDPAEASTEADAVAGRILAELPSDMIRVPVEVLRVTTGLCVSCLNCRRLCPHGAIENYLDKTSVTILSSACWECGICAAACPGQAISHGGLSHEQMQAMLTEATRSEQAVKPAVVFACQQSAVPSLNSAGRLGLHIPADTAILEVPCAGRVDENAILSAVEQGARQVTVMACHPDVCRSIRGNLLAMKRVDRVRAMLKDAGVDPEIVRFCGVANNEPYRVVKLLAKTPTTQQDQAATALEQKEGAAQ